MYRRPEGTGDKLDGRWIGPCIIRGREPNDSYLVETEPGVIKKSHRRFLKPYIVDRYAVKPFDLFYHRRTPLDEGVQPGEWETEKNFGP